MKTLQTFRKLSSVFPTPFSIPPRSRSAWWVSGLLLVLAITTVLPSLCSAAGKSIGHFVPVATYTVSGSVAEIVAATPDGMALFYTDSAEQEVGVVDISNPRGPVELGKIAVAGTPTSVAVTPNGLWALVVVHGEPTNSEIDHVVVVRVSDGGVEHVLPLGGQPDSIAISADGRYAAIVIENERNEELNEGALPQLPGGFLTIVDLVGAPAAWTTRDVALVGLADRFPNDPEPEFVDINSANQAAVTLQENNHVVIVDLPSGLVVGDWSAGTVTHVADLEDDDQIVFDDLLLNARREPDAIAWTAAGNLITANEGDYDLDLNEGEFVGGRNFTIFSSAGAVVFDSGAEVEVLAARAHLYNDGRSDAKGVEIEGVEIGTYGGQTFVFVGAERGDFVAVYLLGADEANPRFVQILATGERPEGLLAIPQRDLFVSANEGDGTISIFARFSNGSR
jgi:DNA-binding beta-propeller fold protein YncE